MPDAADKIIMALGLGSTGQDLTLINGTKKRRQAREVYGPAW